MNRRQFISRTSTATGALAIGTVGNLMINRSLFAKEKEAPHFFMPDESAPHKRTWMAFVANDAIWHKRQQKAVKANLALIANTIAQYEPVAVLVNERDYREATQQLTLDSARYPITLFVCNIDDLWLRDTAPLFVKNLSNQTVALDFNFNGWGGKQAHHHDKHVAAFVAEQAKVPLYKTRITLEGGCIEVDGEGSAIATESCIINDNRNLNWSKAELTAELKRLLGVKNIIWLKGIKDHDITDGHTDFYARFAGGGQVIVSRDNDKDSFDYCITRENITLLKQSSDARQRTLNIAILETPTTINHQFGVSEFAAGYVGYYVCNGAVIAQRFGDKEADEQCLRLLQARYPDRVVEQIAIDGIASGGGSIHCTTQQEII